MRDICTKRLRLRELRKQDEQAIHNYSSDPEVTLYMNWGPNVQQDTTNFIQKSIASQSEQPRTDFTLAVILQSKNKLIGSCGIYLSNPSQREGFIGYVFSKSVWGKGYATETAAALVKFGFENLKLHRIFATCDPQNSVSARVLEKVGMQKEGCLRQNYWVRGKWRDSLLFAILENDFKTGKQDFTRHQETDTSKKN